METYERNLVKKENKDLHDQIKIVLVLKDNVLNWHKWVEYFSREACAKVLWLKRAQRRPSYGLNHIPPKFNIEVPIPNMTIFRDRTDIQNGSQGIFLGSRFTKLNNEISDQKI